MLREGDQYIAPSSRKSDWILLLFQSDQPRAATRPTGATATAWRGSGVMRSPRRERRLQVAQDPIERRLVGVVVFPSAEVANMGADRAAFRPRLGGLHHRLVDPDGKQHGLAATASLLGERLADFVLHPIVSDGALREDQQQLVPDANGRVDRVPGFRADRQVGRREPAPHPAVLQVGVQPLGASNYLQKSGRVACLRASGLVQRTVWYVDRVRRSVVGNG
jgi:hypothetical protein